MMHMTFYWGKNVTVLFDFWKTDSWISYALTLFACFLFSVFYQYMEDRRLRFKLASLNSNKNKPNSINTPLLRSVGGGARVAGGLLFGVNSAIGYLLMLAIMSFNAGVFIAVVVGLGAGYLIFGAAATRTSWWWIIRAPVLEFSYRIYHFTPVFNLMGVSWFVVVGYGLWPYG